MAIKENYLVEKRNILNELRSNKMNLQELRFFSIYLSKINSRDSNSRVVRFPLEDFRKIMDLGKLRLEYLKAVTNSLLSKIVNIPLEKKGSYIAFQLFKECVVVQDETGEWYIEIDAHDRALPLMFDFKDKYFTYQLWNTLGLKSTNQFRMYEILKQYEIIKTRILSIEELKELLGIAKTEYARWDNFKRDVLDVCKKALEENTDIKFTYEPYGKRGKGNKILSLKFTISKNNNYKNPLSLEEFIDIKNNHDENSEDIINQPFWSKFSLLKEACNKEFSDEEFKIIYDMVLQIVPVATMSEGLDISQYNYIMRKYDELNLNATKTRIINRFAYFKKLVTLDFEKL